MKLILIVGVTLFAASITAGCGESTSSQPAAENHEPSALLTTDPHWIPDSGDITLVKTSTLDNCPRNTVEQEVNSYLGSPRWEAGADSTGRDFVNVSGIVTYHGKPAAATLQFLIDKDKRGFKYQAFTVSGVSQPGYVAAMTLREMCSSASKAPINIIKILHAATG
ncbi:MAG: hypothetical protein ACRER0_00795 [Gammaproteobacteria bacterium]